MTQSSGAAGVIHGTFTLARLWKASPQRVFAAWADLEVKALWFTAPPDQWTLIERTLDFREGGHEVLEGRFASGRISRYAARYHLIEPASRLVYAYDMHINGGWHSVSLATLVLEPEGHATRVTYTEQIAFLDGSDGTASRREGTEELFRRIEMLALDPAIEG